VPVPIIAEKLFAVLFGQPGGPHLDPGFPDPLFWRAQTGLRDYDFLPKQFTVDALYPHREHLPVKVRKFIDVVAKNLRHIDWHHSAGKNKPVAITLNRHTSRPTRQKSRATGAPK
jgi:hypothetical protein